MNVPFIQIRSISNYVGERDKTKWKMKEAIENLNQTLLKYVNRLYKIK
jgi:futalosine hydrolase